MLFPQFDPIAVHIGSFGVRWYGLMYMLAFLCAWLLGRYRASRSGGRWKPEEVDDLLLMGMLGVVVGGRLGYMLFYDFAVVAQDPFELLRLWNGGMSFHGGLVGVLVALWWWGRRHGHAFLDIMDFGAPLVPTGLLFGRIGNFINGELWGAPTTLPWGMALTPGGVFRHPSQLYEAFFEGALLFMVLWGYSSRPHPRGRVAGLFALGYGIARFGVEFVRLPDAHIGYLAFGWLTMGQLLTLPLLFVGAWLFFRPGPFFKPGTTPQKPAEKNARSRKRR